MRSSPNYVVDVYNKYIKYKNDKNREKRYEGNEHWYHASGAGSCSRKLYFESVEQVKPTNPMNEDTLRLLRLGTIVHDDLEKALELHNNSIYNTLVYNTRDNNSIEKEINNKEKVKFHTEQEITIEELNVRGFYDVVMEEGEGEEKRIYLNDLKTSGSWAWKMKFGKTKQFNPSIHYELQLGTYGYAIQEQFGRLDGMFLLYYNKDTSKMKSVEIPLTYVSRAYLFWKNIKDEHKQGLPMFRKGVSPVQDWQCNYCQFKDHCNPIT